MNPKKGQSEPKKTIKNGLVFANQWTNFVRLDVEYYDMMRKMISKARNQADLLEAFNLKIWHDVIQVRLTCLSVLEDGRFSTSVDTNVIRISSNFYDAWHFIIERERKIYQRIIQLLRIAKSEGLLLESVKPDVYEKAAFDRIDQIDKMQREKFIQTISI